jgi:arabinofuranosyltransferase
VRPSPSDSARRLELTAWVSLLLGVLVTAALFGWGAWQRRWIADDGLIVLRTVRNLLAGNGPVFNAGERVESNTSTLWTYLVYLGGVLGGPVRLEYVALVLGLVLSLLGIMFVMLGAARLYAPSLLGRRAVLLPAGALVYIAVPPARDFATSGLENSLVLAYLGLLWWMMVSWSHQRRTGRGFTAALAFVAGLSVLVRPELALIGGLALVMMLIAVRGRRTRVLIVMAGGLLPIGYQIFRMGYYGLLVSATALAKDASGKKWSQGFIYLANFNAPYALWVPAILVVVLAVLVLVARSRLVKGPSAGAAARTDRRRIARLVQSPPAVVLFIIVSGLLQGIYWIRQGGDFMHGRVLLTPLFCVLAPVAMIPLFLPDRIELSRDTGTLLAGATATAWLAVAGWALWAANSPGMGADATSVTYTGIVDERRFYAQATGNAHPLTATDYLDYPRMRAVIEAINNTPVGALLLPSGNYTQWDVVPAKPPPPAGPGLPPDPKAMENGPHTVFFTNLGMLGMNVGLDVRVLDQIGLANPLAAHTARLEDARIGHDKNLFPDWAVADGPWLKENSYLPPYLDEDWVTEAEAALKCPATDTVLKSIRGPLTVRQFYDNLVHAYQFTSYRIDRVPKYELIRCGLSEPPLRGTSYTGLPATGP